MFDHKKSKKLKLGVKFEVGKIDNDPFQEEEDETNENKAHIKDLKIMVWSTDPKTCTKQNINDLIDTQYSVLNKRFDKLSDYLEGSNWIIYRWH